MSVESCSNNFVATHAKNWIKTGVKSVLLIVFQILMGQDRNSAILRTIRGNPGRGHSRMFTRRAPGGGRGRVLLSNVLNGGRSAPRCNHLPLYVPLWTKKGEERYTFSYNFIKNGVPFTYLLKASLLLIISQVAINKLKYIIKGR